MQLPANALQSFDIMVQVVSFDYFPVADVIDLGFTPTDAWSVNFDYLDYQSVNFIEGLGSITIFMWIGTLYLIAVAIKNTFCKKSCRGKRMRDCCRPLDAWYSALGFLSGTFFEIMVCLSVSMKMLGMLEFLNSYDKFSIANQLVTCLIMVLYIFFSVFFALCRAPKLVKLHQHS